MVTALEEGTEILAHEVTLLTAENRTLRKASEALSKRRRAKKMRIRQRVLDIEEARDIIAQKEAEEQARRDKRSGEGFQNEGQSTARRCGTCGKTGYNARTCQKDVDISSLSESEEFE